ncbi:MAG TPA: ubiquitin-conjugating enzyme E2 [Kofleriaceae bacterium]|nr:ubiquitin-conjugating enzyme E2 [Kofleriaceae bacterium]
MDNVRLRRLKSDYEALRRLAHLHPKIEIEGVQGNPPDRYRLKLKVKSIREKGDEIEVVNEHRLEVTMPRGYPRDAPLFRMLTPVFHPNVAPHAVCIGDDWTASEALDTLIQRVGEILSYQSYNTKSPLNGRAAQWVDENKNKVPIDKEEFFVDLNEAAASMPGMAAVQACSNCGAQNVALKDCDKQHKMCSDCQMHCGTCGRMLCLTCGEKTCTACSTSCGNCGTATKRELMYSCQSNKHTLCRDCCFQCQTCKDILCLVCNTVPCPRCQPSPQPRSTI